MSFNPHYRNWNAEQWAATAWSIGDLKRRGWRVTAHCERRTCRIVLRVRLDWIAAVRGWDYSLWGRRARCPVEGCIGRVYFVCHPPQVEAGVWMHAVDYRPMANHRRER